ncbi:hypothetical protein [Bradyrhizobium lablabi]|uniref:hypothetical protein n=1 Tax=Bradyrhizobium lablabi TaxID=722472 RepID=UPI0009A5779D|nr:hypothetical protein [Bradyrhizobium lablabi]
MTVLASVLLASEVAQAQTTVGPGDIGSTINATGGGGSTLTVLGSTNLLPPLGVLAANVGPGNLILDPAAGSAFGPITVNTEDAIGIRISATGNLTINPTGSAFPTTITTMGPNASALLPVHIEANWSVSLSSVTRPQQPSRKIERSG